MMAMSIYQVKQFDLLIERDEVITAYQADVTCEPNSKIPAESITELKLITKDFHRGFSYIQIEHETKKTDNIRIQDHFYEFFFMRQKKVAFYNQNEKILLILANKQLAKEIVGRILNTHREKFKLVPETEQKEFDFDKINRDADLINTWGAWFKNVGFGNVTSMAIFGDHVQLHSTYEDHVDKLSSINVEMLIDGEPMKLIISKDMRISFLTAVTYPQMIDYYYVVKNLFD